MYDNMCVCMCIYIYIFRYAYTYIYLMLYTVPSLRNVRRYAYETLVKKIRTGQGQKEDESTLTDKAKEIITSDTYVYSYI